MNVLVVDDEPAVRHLIDAVLTRRGHHVLVAAGPDAAASMLIDFQRRPDVAVLDISLPDMNGVTYADMLAMEYPGLRLIFITGRSRTDERVLAARDRGLVLHKPFVNSDLVSLVETGLVTTPLRPLSSSAGARR